MLTTQLNALRHKTTELNTAIYALYLAYTDARVKGYVRLLLVAAIGYALSPIDLIPDLTAVFGFLDDVVIVALGLRFSYRLLPKEALGQARAQAYAELGSTDESAIIAYRVVGYAWLLTLAALAAVAYKLIYSNIL